MHKEPVQQEVSAHYYGELRQERTYLSEVQSMHSKCVIMWHTIMLGNAACSKGCKERGAGPTVEQALCKVCAVLVKP